MEEESFFLSVYGRVAHQEWEKIDMFSPQSLVLPHDLLERAFILFFYELGLET